MLPQITAQIVWCLEYPVSLASFHYFALNMYCTIHCINVLHQSKIKCSESYDMPPNDSTRQAAALVVQSICGLTEEKLWW